MAVKGCLYLKPLGMQVAVKISIHEGVGHRRSLVLDLIPRDQLPASELMDKGIGAIRRVGSGDDELTS